MKDAPLDTVIDDLTGRLFALDFAVKMLITQVPDLKGFQDRWTMAAPSAVDRLFDHNAHRAARHACAQTLQNLAIVVESELFQRR